jgi:hypothetical protein
MVFFSDGNGCLLGMMEEARRVKCCELSAISRLLAAENRFLEPPLADS